jgi:hypothetical protein
VEGGLVFRTAGTWPRTKALYCHPVGRDEWPADAEIVERAPVRSCQRRGAAIDLVLERRRENRSQLVFTRARGREAVFWQSPRTRKQARPDVRVPTARALGVAELEVLVDTRERYPYRFADQQVTTVRRALQVGDYAVEAGDRLVASVERKSIADLVSSLLDGTLRYALGELATLPRAAVVVEDRYSAVFKLERVRPARVADGLAELQVRWPTIPIVFSETRKLAEEWTYRYLAAAAVWAADDEGLTGRLQDRQTTGQLAHPPAAEVRAWARRAGLVVADRGRLPAEVVRAWHEAHGTAQVRVVTADETRAEGERTPARG